jgi:CBS domain containing-hemolysin-like protein
VEDLSALLDTAQSRQALHEDEQELLSDVLELSGRPVREVMTPRVDMAWLDESFTGEQVLDLVRKTGHHKFPVARRSLDGEVVGLLNAKTYLAARSFRRARNQAGDPPAKEHIEPATYIPDRAGLDRLLEHLRRTGTHTALCVDERGELTGLVQVEDVVRELVDAAPEPGRADGGGVREVGPGVWCVPGRLTVRDWREYFERSGSASPIDARVATVGGLVLAKLGRVPRAGDSVRLGAIELRVARMNGRRIEEVLVSRAGEGAS